MCKRSDNSKSNGFLWGLVVGATLGVLFAPEPGEKTRKKLKKVGNDYKELGLETYSLVSDKYENVALPLAKQVEQQLAPLLMAANEASEPAKQEIVDTIAGLLHEYGKHDTWLDRIKKKL